MAEGQATDPAVGPVNGAMKEEPRRRRAPTCADCFFGANGLCALGLDEPCPTYRPNLAEGLVPPRQPPLLMRDAA